MRNKMLIRITDNEEFRNPVTGEYDEGNGKYYVCYAEDGSPVSQDTNFRYFKTKLDAKQYIQRNNGILTTE